MIRNDAGADATSIGHVLSTFAQAADAEQIDAVFADHGRDPSDARATVEQLAADLEEQREGRHAGYGAAERS